MATHGSTIQHPRVVSHEQWVAERIAFMAKEKELTLLKDELSRQRRELPWEKVTKAYVFDGPNGKETLAQLFEGRSQLLMYHFMFGPEEQDPCTSCSWVADHFDAALPHLAARDVTLVVASRAPLAKLEAFKQRMGWRFKWVSSYGTDFNYDFGVSTTSVVAPYNYGSEPFVLPEKQGASVFARDGDDVFRTYSTYGRGVEASWEPTGISTWCPRDATKRGSSTRWRGCATTIATRADR